MLHYVTVKIFHIKRLYLINFCIFVIHNRGDYQKNIIRTLYLSSTPRRKGKGFAV